MTNGHTTWDSVRIYDNIWSDSFTCERHVLKDISEVEIKVKFLCADRNSLQYYMNYYNYPTLSYLLSIRYPTCSFLSMTTGKFIPNLGGSYGTNLKGRQSKIEKGLTYHGI